MPNQHVSLVKLNTMDLMKNAEPIKSAKKCSKIKVFTAGKKLIISPENIKRTNSQRPKFNSPPPEIKSECQTNSDFHFTFYPQTENKETKTQEKIKKPLMTKKRLNTFRQRTVKRGSSLTPAGSERSLSRHERLLKQRAKGTLLMKDLVIN